MHVLMGYYFVRSPIDRIKNEFLHSVFGDGTDNKLKVELNLEPVKYNQRRLVF